MKETLGPRYDIASAGVKQKKSWDDLSMSQRQAQIHSSMKLGKLCGHILIIFIGRIRIGYIIKTSLLVFSSFKTFEVVAADS